MGLHQINWNFENKKFISLIMLSGCFLLTGEKKKLKRKEKATRSSLRDLVLSFLHWSHFFNRNFYTPTTLQWAAAAAWYPLFMTLTPPVIIETFNELGAWCILSEYIREKINENCYLTGYFEDGFLKAKVVRNQNDLGMQIYPASYTHACLIWFKIIGPELKMFKLSIS